MCSVAVVCFFFVITCVRIEFIVAEINQLDFIFLGDALYSSQREKHSPDNLEFILYSSRPCDTADLSMGIVRIGHRGR
jgi:hypothetical protein